MPSKYRSFLTARIERPKGYLEVDRDKNELFLYDEIGYWGVTADDVASVLKDVDPTSLLTVCINSPGGDVFDGITIANLLRGRGNVEIRIDGFAASIASIIALAGDKVLMADNASFMIHNPWTIVVGDSADMRHQADVLDKIKSQLITTYQKKSDLDVERISALMDDETWFTAEEAKENGFVDEVFEPGSSETQAKLQNQFDLSIYRNCPDRLREKQREQPTSGGGEAKALRRYHFQRRHEINISSV